LSGRNFNQNTDETSVRGFVHCTIGFEPWRVESLFMRGLSNVGHRKGIATEVHFKSQENYKLRTALKKTPKMSALDSCAVRSIIKIYIGNRWVDIGVPFPAAASFYNNL
jgi:hypothetical protein